MRVEVDTLIVGVCVNLDEVATLEIISRVIGALHLGDVNTIFAHIYLVAELITTLVFAIDD